MTTIYRKKCLAVAVALVCASEGSAQNRAPLEEVIVTATRQEAVLSDVPISITAFSQDQLDAQGLKDFDDLQRYTPGLSLNRTVNGGNDIALRGISSSAGTGTTGIYIDDTPIQTRALGFAANTAFPAMFDLERVEVLRGPQGTLFGAGSEGGTIRFIQTVPSLTDYSSYARAELSATPHGDPTYEGGYAIGGPIREDKLGFRMSAFYRREGGYIDGVTGNATIVDPSGISYGDSVEFERTATPRPDMNSNSTMAARAALTIAATDNLTITPSVSYQRQERDDGFNAFWVSSSDVESRDYSRRVTTMGDPGTVVDPAAGALTALPPEAPNEEEGEDEFTLAALVINWQLDGLELVSNTSFFDRDQFFWFDVTQGYKNFYLVDSTEPYVAPGLKGASLYSNAQENVVQEIRLQSTDPDARLSWVAGVFFSDNEQTALQSINVNFLANASTIGFSPFFAGMTDGPPFGPGATALENFQGVGLGPDSQVYSADFRTVDRQLAGFAEMDFQATERLGFTFGLRYSRNELDYAASYGGAETNLNAPFGLPCVPNTFCANPAPYPDGDFVPVGSFGVGEGPFTPLYPSSASSGSETSTTPKIGVTYDYNDDSMLYATVAKGFRPGGASLRAPTVCNQDLIDLGYVDENGLPAHPLTYGSDSVWSYEVGTKTLLFDGRLSLDASVYLIDWSDIQTQVLLPECFYDFVDNLADATSKGFDLGFQAAPIDGLIIGGTVGYTDATYDQDAVSPGGVVIEQEGDYVEGGPDKWTLSLYAQYDFQAFGGREAFVRGDFTTTPEARLTGALDPSSPNFNSLLRPVPDYGVLNLRLGLRLGGVDLALFVNNATDENPELALNGGGFFNPYNWTDTTLRARTWGVSMIYRN